MRIDKPIQKTKNPTLTLVDPLLRLCITPAAAAEAALCATWWRYRFRGEATSTPWWTCARSWHWEDPTRFSSPSSSPRSGSASSAPIPRRKPFASPPSPTSSLTSATKPPIFPLSTKPSWQTWKRPSIGSSISSSRRSPRFSAALSCAGPSPSQIGGIFRWLRFGPCRRRFTPCYITLMSLHSNGVWKLIKKRWVYRFFTSHFVYLLHEEEKEG